MKKLAITLISTLLVASFASSAFAQHGSQPYKPLLKKIGRIKAELNSLTRQLRVMAPQELEDASIRLDNSLDALLGVMLPTMNLVTVTGSIENQSFMYEVVGVQDLAAQCIQQFNRSGVQVDDAAVAVDFGSNQKIHTSGWWKSAGEVCSEIAKKAKLAGLSSEQISPVMASGAIENTSFSFAGNSKGELMRQCTDLVAEKNINQVDDIVVIGNSNFKRLHTSGWWRSANDICTLIVQVVQ